MSRFFRFLGHLFTVTLNPFRARITVDEDGANVEVSEPSLTIEVGPDDGGVPLVAPAAAVVAPLPSRAAASAGTGT